MTGTVKEDTTSRSRRKGTFLGLCITLLLVAVTLAITGLATRASGLFIAAAVVALGALVVYILARRAAVRKPPEKDPP